MKNAAQMAACSPLGHKLFKCKVLPDPGDSSLSITVGEKGLMGCMSFSLNKLAGQKRILAVPATILADPDGTLAESDGALADFAKVLANPDETLADPAKVLADPAKTLADFAKVLADPDKTLADFAKVLADPDKTLADPARALAGPEMPLEVSGVQPAITANTMASIGRVPALRAAVSGLPEMADREPDLKSAACIPAQGLSVVQFCQIETSRGGQPCWAA